jgi:hypothetical protein
VRDRILHPSGDIFVVPEDAREAFRQIALLARKASEQD